MVEVWEKLNLFIFINQPNSHTLADTPFLYSSDFNYVKLGSTPEQKLAFLKLKISEKYQDLEKSKQEFS